MAGRILEFMDQAAKPVHVRRHGKVVGTASCLDVIERGLVVGNPEEYNPTVQRLWMSSDFRVLQGMLFDLREEAKELGLRRKDVEPILREVVGRLLPDSRPLKVRRGEFRLRVISELKEIRTRRRELKDFTSLKNMFPAFEVVRLVSGPEFDDEYRAYLASPGRWETKSVSFAHGILKKYWGLNSEETLRSYSKAFTRFQRGTSSNRRSRQS